MRRRSPPPHLEHISGAELRRREERPKRSRTSDAMALRVTEPDLARRLDEDRQNLPPGDGALCLLCGADVRWTFNNRPQDHARNRDGTLHRDSCQPRRSIVTTAVAEPRQPAATPLITVGASPRNARTDPTTGLRFYLWQGQEYPSVTTVRRMAGIPHGLHQWAIGQVVTHVLGNAPEIARRLAAAAEVDAHHGAGSQLGYAAVRQIIARELRAAATAERDRAAALGTAVHDAAATGRTVLEVDEALRPRLTQYLHWLEVSGAEILATEFQVWSTTVGYAGTADLLVRLRDGSIWVVDLKTGKGVYGEYALQLIAYLMADFVGNDDVIDEEATALLHQAQGMAVLHLADDHWEYLGLRPDSDTWAAFRGLLKFATWMATHGDVASITTASRKGSAEVETAA